MADQDYQTTLEEWLANGKQIDEYYAYLKQIVGDKLADIQDAKLKYIPAHIELPTAMYVYKPADLPNLATHLANSDYDDFSILWDEYEEYLKDIREAFSTNEPQEPSFKKQSNYLKEHAAWSANQIEVEKFLADFKKALEKVQVEREKADEQYAFKAVAVEIIYDGKSFTPTNVAEFETFVNAFTSAMPLISLKYHLDTEKTSKIDAIKSQNPADKPFFNPYRQSQETLKYDANLTSATQFFDALKAAIAKVEQEKKEQDAQHAYTGLNEYIVVHNEAGKAYVIGAGDEDYKTLLTKLDEADEKVFAELEAWSPDTIDGLFQFAKPSENSFFYKYKAQESLDAWNKDYDAFKDFKAAFPTTLAAVKKQFLDMDKNFAYHAAPLPLEWNSKTWGITIESDIEADPKQIAALGESDIKAALSELQTYKKGKLETIAVLKPDEEDFNFKSNFKAAFAEWETDKKNHEEFFAKLEKLYNDALTYLQNPSPQVDANASPLIPQAYFHWYTGNLSGLVFCDGKHYAGKFPSVSEIQAFDESSIIYAMEELLNDAANADSAAQSYDAKPTDADYTTKHAQWLSEHNDLEAFFNAIDNALHAALQAKQSPNASPAAPSVDDNLIKEAAKYGYHWCKIFFQYSSGGSPLIGTTSGVTVITWDENHFPSVADLKKEKQNTLSITQTLLFTVQKKKIEEAIKNQHNPYSSTSKEGKVFNAVQNANLTRLDAFFAKLDSLFNQAQGITSGTTSGGATTGTTSVNTSTSNGGYEWVDANFEMTEGPVSHTFELGISVVYTLMLDFSSDYLKKSAQELIKQEDLSLQAVKAKELSSNVQTDNPDAYTAAYNDNLAQITAFWKEVKAGIQTAIKIKAGNGVGYNWIPVKYEFDYKGSGTTIWKEWLYPSEADLAQEPLDLLQYIDGDLSKYRDSLLDQVNAQNYANGDLAGDVVFKIARKENKERITSFFQDLTLLVAGAIDQKTGTSTANTYQWVDIYWEIDSLKVKITPQSGVNFELLKNLDIATLEQLSNDTPALKEHFANLIDANKPDDSDAAAKKSWNENYGQNVSFWQQVNIAIGNAFDAVKANAVGYKWVDVEFDFTSTKSGMHMVFKDSYPPNIDKMMAKLDGSDLNQLSAELSTKKEALLNQITSQQPNANLSTKEQGAFTNGQKSNESRLKYFYQSLASSANYALLFLDADDEDYDEIETIDDATSTSISNYTPVPIELAVEESATKQKKTFTPETGIDILFLVDKVDYTDLKNIDLEAEEGSNLFELANAEPQQQDYPEGSGYDYNASHADWEKNCETAKAFWDKAKFAIEAALKLKGVDCSTGGYKWITPQWTCNVNNKKYSDGTILPSAASFVGFTKEELDACLNDMNKTSDKLNDDVHKQTCNTKNANAVKVFDDLQLSNIVALLSFFAQVKEALESAASQYDSQSAPPKPNDTLNGASTSAVDNKVPSTPPVNDPEYQWIDIEWNFKIGKSSYKASEQHNNVINYDTLAKKCSLNVVQKLLSDFEQQRAALTDNITANEPLQGAFASPVNYQKERAMWQENVNRNNAFWNKLREGLENTVHVLNAPSCGYKWVPIVFSPSAISPYVLFDGNFTLGSLKGHAESSLNEIKNEIPAFYDAVKLDIESQKTPDSLSDDKKEQFEIVKSGNLKALDMFREKLYWAIDVLLAEINGGAPSSEAYFVPTSIQSAAVYQWVDISWTISEKDKDGNPLTLTFNSYDKISSNELAQIPNLYLKSYLDPKSVKNVKKAGKTLAKQIQSKKPIKKDFYFVADYNTAFAEWERNKEDNEVFWIVAEENLNVAFQMNVGKTFKYNWIDAEWTYSGGKFRMGDGKNPTIQDFVSYSATDLQLMIDSIEPQKQALIQKVDAQKPSDVQLTSAIDIEAFEKAQKENRFRIEDFFDNILQGALEGALQKINDLLATAKPVVSASTYNVSAISFNTPNNPRTVDITATSATPTFRDKTEISQLRLVWIEMTCKQLKDSERELFEKAKDSWIQYMGANEPNTSKDTGMTFWNDGLAALDSLIQSKEALLNQSPDSPTDFPSDISSLKVIKKLGGSTGAQLVEDANGNRYVMKKGGSAGGAAGEHLKSECAADAFYRAAGVRVPDFQIYEDANGNPVKLSRYMEGMTELGSWWNNASQEEKDIMRAKLREHYAIDVLLGNWDVVGMGADNIMIDSNGEPWRIDNGGSLNYRAQGATKDTVDKSAWGEDCFIDDLWTMTGNGQRIGSSVASTIKKYYGDIDVLDIANRIMESSKNWTQNPLDYLSEADKKAVQKRLEETRQIADRGNGCIEGTFTREYTLDIIDHSYQWSKEGLREATSEKLDLENYQYGWIRGGAGSGTSGADPTALKNLDIQTKIKDALITINHHNAPGNDMQPNQATVNAALALKTELQAALKAGEPGAQHYLDLLDMIEAAYNNHTQTPYENGKPKIQDTSLDIYAKPKNTSGVSKTDDLRSKYPGGFQAYMRAEMGDEAITFIEKCNKSQGYNSYNVDSCYTKFLRLRAQGYNLNDYSDFESFYKAIPKDEDGYYVGDPNGSREGSYSPGTHYDHFATAFQHCKNGTVDFDKRYTEMVKYNAALQIALENCEFTGNDKNTRSLVLMRTESASVVKTKTKGKKSKHTRGVNESHSLIRTVCVGGHYLTIIRVPYSRINGFYMLKQGMYLGDGENEVSADTHGLPAYYFEKVSSGRHVSEYMQEFLEMEKNNP